jgi:hypothetical protein
VERWGDLDARYEAVLAAELARAGTRPFPADFPRPGLPPALRETIRAAALLADATALVEFYCDRMPRMLIDQLLRDDSRAGELLWMPIDPERVPRLRTATRGLGRALVTAGVRGDVPPDPLAPRPSAAALAAGTLLGSGLPMVGAYPAERVLLAEELSSCALPHERLDLRLSCNLVHEMCHGERRRHCAGTPPPWLVVEAAAAHLGATAFSRHLQPEVPGEAVPGLSPFLMVGDAFARLFGVRPLWSVAASEPIEVAFGERAGRALTVAGWQDWLRRREPPFARDASRGPAWVKLADAARAMSSLSTLPGGARNLEPLSRVRDLPDLLDGAASVPWRELPWWAEEPNSADAAMARHAVRAMFQADVLEPTFQTHPYRPSSLHLDTESCLLTRERAERGVGPGEPPAWIVPPPLCRRLARAGVRRLSVGGGESRALLSRLLEGA